MATLVFTRGGDFMDAARTAYTLDTPEMRQALAMMQGLIRKERQICSASATKIRPSSRSARSCS